MSIWRRFWMTNYFVGIIKWCFFQCCRLIWGYDSWHRTPINRKSYAVHIIETLESLIANGVIKDGYIVEVGCGKGDIIGNIRYGKKLGIDIEQNVLDAAKFFHPETTFQQGEIKDILVDKIDALIIVGWLHKERPELFHELLSPYLNHTKVLCFDVWLDNRGNRLTGDRFSQDGNYLGDGKFVLWKSSKSEKTSTGGNPCLKHLEYWIRKECKMG